MDWLIWVLEEPVNWLIDWLIIGWMVVWTVNRTGWSFDWLIILSLIGYSAKSSFDWSITYEDSEIDGPDESDQVEADQLSGLAETAGAQLGQVQASSQFLYIDENTGVISWNKVPYGSVPRQRMNDKANKNKHTHINHVFLDDLVDDDADHRVEKDRACILHSVGVLNHTSRICKRNNEAKNQERSFPLNQSIDHWSVPWRNFLIRSRSSNSSFLRVASISTWKTIID